MSGKNNRRFPVLRASEIVEYLEPSCDIAVSEQDINKPNAAFMMRLYQAFADVFMNVQYGQLWSSPETQAAMAEAIQSITDHNDLFLDSLPFLTFYRELYVSTRVALVVLISGCSSVLLLLLCDL